MKNVLLLLSIALMPLLGNAQTFLTQSGTSDNRDSTYTGYTGDLYILNAIKSASSSSVILTWQVTDFSVTNGWKMTGFCDNLTCYNNDASVNPPKGAILNGTVYTSSDYKSSFDDFHAIFDPTAAPNGSIAWIKVFVFDAVGNYGRNLTFTGHKNATGVYSVSVSSDDVTLFPNPAHNAVNVVYNDKAGIKTIAVYNIIGKLMGPIYRPISASSAKIDLEDMPNGVYFIRLMNAQGQVVATRRFSRQ